MKAILDINEVAEILGTTPQSIRNQISRRQEGVSIPHSFKLGNRRVWHNKKVYAWLEQKADDAEAAHLKNRAHFKKKRPERRIR